jgi:hypothetical protein
MPPDEHSNSEATQVPISQDSVAISVSGRRHHLQNSKSMETSDLLRLIHISMLHRISSLQVEPTSIVILSIQRLLSEHGEASIMIQIATFPSYEERGVLPMSQEIWESELPHRQKN